MPGSASLVKMRFTARPVPAFPGSERVRSLHLGTARSGGGSRGLLGNRPEPLVPIGRLLARCPVRRDPCLFQSGAQLGREVLEELALVGADLVEVDPVE